MCEYCDPVDDYKYRERECHDLEELDLLLEDEDIPLSPAEEEMVLTVYPD